MKRWVAVVAILIGCLGVGASVSMGQTPADGLWFEQAGPADASIAPFAVEVGTGRSTQKVVFVTSDTFAKLLGVLQSQVVPERQPYPSGTLHVMSYQGGKLSATYTIYPEAMLPVMIRLIKSMSPNPT